MKTAFLNITGTLLFPFSGMIVFEILGIAIESLVVVWLFRRWRAGMTSWRLVEAIVLANIVSWLVGGLLVFLIFGFGNLMRIG